MELPLLARLINCFYLFDSLLWLAMAGDSKKTKSVGSFDLPLQLLLFLPLSAPYFAVVRSKDLRYENLECEFNICDLLAEEFF
jgi:hypothetical protein